MDKKSVTIDLPEESFELIELKGNNIPAICLVNQSLLEFKQQSIFGWQCSITLDLQDLDDKDMPTQSERYLLNHFFKKIDSRSSSDATNLELNWVLSHVSHINKDFQYITI